MRVRIPPVTHAPGSGLARVPHASRRSFSSARKEAVLPLTDADIARSPACLLIVDARASARRW
jgi:hypothetical protein